MRVAAYLRVSTAEQSTATQRRELQSYCQARGWADVVEYEDTGWSGARERRPGLDRLMRDVQARRVDVVVVAAFDRFARSTRHLINALDTFQHYGVAFVSLRESIDTASPMGRMVFVIVAAVAELERSLIAERVRQGLARRKAEGRRLGRRPVVVDLAAVHTLLDAGESRRAAARRLGCSEATIRNRLAAAAS
jgi:DNA invertase Pin-like site-specific DNA recombinase